MTLSGIVMASSWNAIGGGTGMFGSATSTVRLPYNEFAKLSEETFSEDFLQKISSRTKNLKEIAEKYSESRKSRERS